MNPYTGKERRAFGRREKYARGEVLIPGHRAIAFTLKDISPNGAFIHLDVNVVPRSQFRLNFIDNKFSILCTVIHIAANGIGVEFLQKDVAQQLYETLRPGL